MKRKNLFLMCGIPGSGKSTWVKAQLRPNKNDIWISRDNVRFSILSDEDEYFAKEDLVFETFCKNINSAIKSINSGNIFVDATHLNEKARNKVLDTLDLTNVDIYPVSFELPLDVCLNQNELRKNEGRTYVPRGVIRRMATQYHPPRDGEKYTYKHILRVGVK